MCEAIVSLNPAWKDKEKRWNPNETVPLYVLIRTLREATQAYLMKCTLLFDTAISASFTDCWEIQTRGSVKVKSHILFMCTGSEAKGLNLPIPTIPLQHALSPSSLHKYIEPHHHVLVFGAQHSGTIVLDSLLKTGCRKVTVVHRHEKPFLFARDGEYDGIKEESEQIANRLLAETPSELEFIQEKAIQKLAGALRSADWAVYAIGFSPQTECRVLSGGASINLADYDSTTGKLPTAGSAWGFGIAFPSRAPDGKHYDVSLHSFAQHILNQKDAILEKYRFVGSTKITNT